MSKPVILAAIFAIGLAPSLPTATASNASFSSLPGNNTSFATAAEYLANWNALESAYPVPPSGYGNVHINAWDPLIQGVSNQAFFGGAFSTDLAYHYQIDFWVEASEAGNFDFRIAPDFGLGGAAFLNGAEVAFNS
ncbi:MAG: hypothetical protein L0Z50_15800, partial [Verrucomicrobiales bacterium]|nr:hypothetical protein [Verrucomicrobiales bacterium]